MGVSSLFHSGGDICRCLVGATSGTRAAAAGGVTTVIDMPLNSVPTTTTPAILKQKIAAVRVRSCYRTQVFVSFQWHRGQTVLDVG